MDSSLPIRYKDATLLPMIKKVKRLFTQFAPAHYNLSLNISEDKHRFSGSVTIFGERRGKPSERITLHQKGLQITSATIHKFDKKNDKQPVTVTRITSHKSYDEVRLHSEQAIYAGKYEIVLEFSGKITRNMDGIYPCFFNDDGTEKQLIATQFESHHAREAFPCIDEPEAKATFDLALTHASEETALSNTLVVNTSVKGSRTTTVFDTTPLMSTYLLAFVVGELSMKETTTKNGVSIRTFATKNQIEHTAFALEEASAYMDFYEEYYDIPFPLKKCDFVALPDFASGAMENWGLITFREQTLLVDPQTSLNTKQYVAIVVAHELTHQWFGNLVTMQWWTDLWLNEGFASWMEYLAVDKRHPEWHMWTQFAVSEQQIALKMDALEHTHPIEVEVRHPDEIRSIFDVISYQKGASVIHMLHDYLGPEGFRDGLRQYLKAFAYKNATTKDLWQTLESVSGKPVQSFMHDWTTNSGFPLVTIKEKNDHVQISQQIFVANPNSQARASKITWPIPLFSKQLESLTVAKPHNNIPYKHAVNSLLLINEGQTGFYRVDYGQSLQNALVTAVEQGELDDIDRMGILSDGFETTKAGYQTVADYLDLLQAYKHESTLPVWEIIASSISAIRAVLSRSDSDEQLRAKIKPFITVLIAGELARLGLQEIEDENHLDTLLRPIIVSMAASADHNETLQSLRTMFDKQLDSGYSINPDLRAVVYSTIARKGGKKEYDLFWKMYESTDSSDEKLSITAAMTSFEQPELHEKLLELLLSERVKFQDVPYWIAYSLSNRHSKVITWEWVKNNWPWIQKNMGTDLSFSRMPIYVARTIAERELQADYTAFFTENMSPVLQRSYLQGLEIIETNTAWRERDADKALDWFTQWTKKHLH